MLIAAIVVEAAVAIGVGLHDIVGCHSDHAIPLRLGVRPVIGAEALREIVAIDEMKRLIAGL
jgi:hypothetical protein